MAKRFSRYRVAYKLNEGASGGALEKWDKFRKGNSAYTRKPSEGSGKQVAHQLTPFSIDMGSDFLAVSLTERALTRMTGVGLSITELKLAVATVNAKEFKMIPARLSAAKAVGSTPETSKITGLPYKVKTSDAFVAPFGAASATEKYGDSIAKIKKAVKDNNKGNSISFTPERITY